MKPGSNPGRGANFREIGNGRMSKKFEITTQIGCPLMCTFCPQDKLQRAYKSSVRVLTQEVFETALNKIPKDFRIVFAGYTEPWTNKQCNNFVRTALQQQRKIHIYTTLYGMTYDQALELIDLVKQYPQQVAEIYIHLPDAKGNMVGWRYDEEYQRVLDLFYTQLTKTRFMTLDSESNINPALNIKFDQRLSPWYLHTRANNLDTRLVQGQKFYEPPVYEFVVECTRDKEFKSNVLLPNGDLSLCCMDYGLNHVLGNILTQTYEEIMNGPVLTKLKEINNSFVFSTESLCKSCNDGHCRTPWNDTDVYHRYKKENPDFKL